MHDVKHRKELMDPDHPSLPVGFLPLCTLFRQSEIISQHENGQEQEQEEPRENAALP